MERKLLIVTISSEPRTRLITGTPSKVEIGHELFEETGAGDTNGFYDFLRQPDGKIVGVRFSPFIEFSDICNPASQGVGLRITGAAPTASVELFWKGAANYDPAQSSDQFFDQNYIFRSESGRFAVTFGFSHLAEGEIDDLLLTVSQDAR